MSTTATVFGNELHRYSIADGIRDHNVLGFDPYKVLTFKDSDLRKAVALEKLRPLLWVRLWQTRRRARFSISI